MLRLLVLVLVPIMIIVQFHLLDGENTLFEALLPMILQHLWIIKIIQLKKAARTVINKVESMGGNGGVIAIDNKGNVAMEMNTSAGMYRAHVNSSGEIDISKFTINK